MVLNEFINTLATLNNKRQIGIIGAAVIDVIADAYSLPYRGSDIELHQQSVNVGGCALNVAITIQRLGLESLNALPMGQGTWSELIRNDLNKKGITSIIQNDSGDNGWCLALVEPDGERTFLSVSGVENQWTTALLAQISLSDNALLYVSGYQLASNTSGIIIDWLESLNKSIQIYVDFGPRIADIAPDVLNRLLALNVIITLNRQEAEYIQMYWLNIAEYSSLNAEFLSKAWHQRYNIPLVIRVDKDGVFYSNRDESGWVPAFAAKVVDTIGAGDSHAGGVLAALASGWSLEQSVRLGNAVASFVVSHRGGDTAPKRDELIEYLMKK